LKYYLFKRKPPAVEIETAKRLGADLAFCGNGDAVTVVYAVSDLGAQKLSEITIRSCPSGIHNPAYYVFSVLSQAAIYLEKVYDLEMEQVTEQKTSQ
jgi:hypothetical protein